METTELNPTAEAVAAARAAVASMPATSGVQPQLPVAVFIHQGAVLAQVARRDRPALLGVNCRLAELDSLEARLLVLREADLAWQTQRTGKGAPQADREQSATQIRDNTLAEMRWYFRDDRDLQDRLDDIAEGDGLADVLHDLAALAAMLDGHVAALPAGCDLDPVARAAECRTAAAATTSGAVAWKASDSDAHLKTARDNAFAYAEAAVTEVRAAGRFAYRKDPKKQADYRDHYTLAKARRARRARLAENPQDPV